MTEKLLQVVTMGVMGWICSILVEAVGQRELAKLVKMATICICVGYGFECAYDIVVKLKTWLENTFWFLPS